MLRIHKKLLITLLFLVTAIIITGCAEKECEVDSDCRDKVCQTASCNDNKCEYDIIEDCCGNNLKEAVENGKPGNKCTCPKDYGACEGVPELTSGSRKYDARYLKHYCDEQDRCVLGFPEEDIRPLTLQDERKFELFELETTVNYNDPFDVKQDAFTFRFRLTDDHENLVPPVRITKIAVKDGELIIAEKQISNVLGGVGDAATVNLPVLYTLRQPEETRSLTFKINYEYNKRVKVGKHENGSIEYDIELERKDYQKKFSTKVNFIETGEV